MDRSSYLRKALLGNAAFSTLCGLDMVFAPDTIARFIGLADPRQLRDLGVSLLFFAACLVVAATRRPISAAAARIFIALDVGWVVGTAALLIARPDVLNTYGIWAAILVADVVAAFAVFQIIGLRRLTRGTSQRHDESAMSPLSPAARA